MFDNDELYFPSPCHQELIADIVEDIHFETEAAKKDNYAEACKYGILVWENLLKVMVKFKAKSIYELDSKNVINYDLMYWASNFADELHNASIRDKSFEKQKLNFCEHFAHMHRGIPDKNVQNLGIIRIHLAESYFKMGDFEKTDSLFKEWLDAEPDWGWGWIGWSDLYWLWENGFEKNFKKGAEILKQGLSIPNVYDRKLMKERLEDLKINLAEQTKGPGAKTRQPD